MITHYELIDRSMPPKKKLAVTTPGSSRPTAVPRSTAASKASSSAKASNSAKSTTTVKKPTPSPRTKEDRLGDEDSWSSDEDDSGEDLKDFIENDDEFIETDDDLSLDESTLTPAQREELEAIRWLHAACDHARRGRMRGPG